MICYHGSVVPNLDILLPFNMPHSNTDEACVYFTAYKPLALFYIWPRKYMWLTYGFNKDDIPVYSETHPGALKEFYNDVKGYIYTCDVADGDILENKTGIKAAIAAKGAQKILDCETAGNVYEKILEHEKSGELIIRRYEELTVKEHSQNEKMIISGIKRLHLLSGQHPLSPFVAHKFPGLWERANREAQK